MAKRYLETSIWDEDWFLLMPSDYKLFFLWVMCKCDHAGFFRPNVEVFNRSNVGQVDLKKALHYFNQEKTRVRVLPNGRWFLEGFICFQYGTTLNEHNRVHFSILHLLGLNDVNLNSIKGLLDHKEGVKDKDKDSRKGGMGENNKFMKPTVDEVKAYCIERKNDVNPESWLDFYESKGWMIGKNKMKDWKAAVRTWEKNSNGNGTGESHVLPAPKGGYA